jgi:predicted N-acetyltransferase YhbS
VAIFRKAKAEEIDALVDLTDRIFRKPGQSSMGSAYSFLFSKENADHLLIAVEDNRPVSLVAMLPGNIEVAGSTLSVASMGAVCTDPAFRGRNYAGTLVEMAIRQCEEEGIHLLLVSGNRSLYRRNDCLEVGTVRTFLLLPENVEAATRDESPDGIAIPYEETRDLEEMLELMVAETTYYHRTKEQFKQLISNAAILSNYSKRQEIVVARADNKVKAYAVFGLSDHEDDRTAEVIEFAGEDQAVLQLFRNLYSMYGVERLQVSIGTDRPSLAEWLASAGGEFRTEPIPGTLRTVHLTGLWDALRPYMEARIGRETLERLTLSRLANGYRIALSGETYTVDRAGAVRLIFDGPPMADESDLKMVLSRIFPIPFVFTKNLNFV